MKSKEIATMNENEVVEATCKLLETEGYVIISRCTTNERGIDIIAKHKLTGNQVLVETKGNTSSKEGSSRFGKPYTNSQVFSHASKGVFACIRLRANNPDTIAHRVMLSVPGSILYKKFLEKSVIEHLNKSNVEVLFV